MGFVARVFQPSTLRMLIWPEASKAQNNIAAVSADGSTVCVLIRRLNSLVQPLDGIRGPCALPLARWQPREAEEPVAGFLQTVGDGTMFEPPFADEGFASSLNLFARSRVDHVVVIGGDLLVQALRRVCQQVPVLVHGTALHRHAIPHGGNCSLKPRRAVDNEEFGTAQAAPDEIVEHSTPGCGTFAAHTLDREQHFLTVRTNADDNQQ